MKRNAPTIPDASVLTSWRKSSYSGGSSGDCLEVADWRKSSHSGDSGGDCLEVNDAARPLVPVRDSKNPTGPAIVFSASAWSAFLGEVR
ncbi:DUF397 domain-containing protein [Streptomyces dysideae]|uniref:Toxin n=1 Tax=Streptomyces dysideae TaxID=909626 RepID=A0A101UXY7_9ACTN|nr:DUF397 domain-containing protein [Streptomyces dysideae]KUO18939.1 toxin [Streptomyces dysideae]